MAGANYMGGRGRTAKDRLKKKNDVKTKEHFAKSQLSAKHLNPFLYYGGIKAGHNRPTFAFQHARLAGATAAPNAAPKSDSTNETPDLTLAKASAGNDTPKSKKRKTPPSSKAMRQLEDAEHISYAHKRMKILELSDFAGLGKLKSAVTPKIPPSEDVEQASPITPFPIVFSQEKSAPVLATPREKNKTDPFLREVPVALPDDCSSSLSLLRAPFSYETPRRPSANRSIPKLINQPIPPSYSSSSSPWPTSASNRDVSGSAPDASFNSLSLDTSFDADTVQHGPKYFNSESVEAFCVQDPWTYLATQMNVELSPSGQTSFLPCDEYRKEQLPPSERSGADFYASLWADRLSSTLDGREHGDVGDGRNLYDYLSPDGPAASNQDGSINSYLGEGIETDDFDTEVNYDPETPEDEVIDSDSSSAWDERSDGSLLEEYHEEILSAEEMCEIDEDPEADLEEISQLDYIPGTQLHAVGPGHPGKALPVEGPQFSNVVVSSSLDIHSSFAPSSSILSFNPTPSSIHPKDFLRSTSDEVELLLPYAQTDDSTQEPSSTLPKASPAQSDAADPLGFLKELDDKLTSEDLPFNIDEILEGSLNHDDVPQKVASNPFERMTAKDIVATEPNALERDRPVPPRSGLTVRFRSPLDSYSASDPPSSLIEADLNRVFTSREYDAAGSSPETCQRSSPPQVNTVKTDSMSRIASRNSSLGMLDATLVSHDGRLIGPSLFEDSDLEGSDDDH
ncbi:hypothetical protein FRC04_000440 [Tulasnella sp. 424]|nr:hypothetical protein FRC04_000440 [Tulasnella sp. 424]KAG8973915.1 hypothetical protein FRC05_008138 [Tulasnella sp. 425]